MNFNRSLYFLKEAMPEWFGPKIDPNNPPILQIVPGSIVFTDASGNNAIDANERCHVKFKVHNAGRGEAFDCVAKVESSSMSVTAGEMEIKELAGGASIAVDIPVKASKNTFDGTLNFSVSVEEPNNLGCDPIKLSVPINAYQQPLLKISDYAINNVTDNMLKKMQPFGLELILQNMKHGLAENVEVSLVLPEGVLLMEGDKKNTFKTIEGGNKKILKYMLIANNAYNKSSIPVKVKVVEKYGMYAESRTINLVLNQQAEQNNIVINKINNSSENHSKIEEAKFNNKVSLSDVDTNIPHNSNNNNSTFAVIIANENYQNESKVEYAINDGNTMKRYLKDVLGIPGNNIRFVKDATLNNIRGEVDWIKQITELYNGEANVIFYYAGHGIPDYSSKDAYLLPVDGYGSNVNTGYKMIDLCNDLSKYPTHQTVVFIDACFSGAQRNGKMMTSARAVGISVNSSTPKGNVILFSAAQGDEMAHPYRDKGHGLFTYFLLKKLQQTNGNTTLGELDDFISDNVMRKSLINNNRKQTPCVKVAHGMADRWKNLRLK